MKIIFKIFLGFGVNFKFWRKLLFEGFLGFWGKSKKSQEASCIEIKKFKNFSTKLFPKNKFPLKTS